MTDLDTLIRGQTDRQTDTHWYTTNEMRPSAAEQLNWLHEKETPKQPLLRQQ